MNKRTRFLLLFGVACVAVISVYLLLSADQKDDHEPLTAQPEKATPSIVNAPKGKPEPQPDQATDDYNPYEDEALKAQFKQIADLYRESAKYPHFSQPINNPESVRDYEPYEKTEVDTLFPDEDGGTPIRLQAALEKYQYFSGDTIFARIRVVGAPANAYVSVVATIAGPVGDTPLKSEMQPTDAGLSEFQVQFDTQLAPPGSFAPEMLMKFIVAVNEQTLFTTVGFRYADASALLLAVPYARQEAEYLNIALQYSVFQAGYYFANAILADAQTGRPLIRLQAEGNMPQGNGLLTMRAHSQALKAAGSEGPYFLRSIQTYRGANDGEQFDAPANITQRQFEVQAVPFSQYDNVDYNDPLNDERTDFLDNVGDVDSEKPEPVDEEPEESE